LIIIQERFALTLRPPFTAGRVRRDRQVIIPNWQRWQRTNNYKPPYWVDGDISTVLYSREGVGRFLGGTT